MLLAINKTVHTKHEGDMAEWPAYLTINNLSHEIQRSRIRPRRLIVGLISIYKEDCLKVKIEIYHQIIGVITKYKSKCHFLYKVIWLNVTALEKVAIKGLLMIWIDENMQKCHPIITSISINYKEQVMITSIKSGIQCTICQVPPNKHQNLYKK